MDVKIRAAAEPVLALIRRYESNDNYNIVSGFIPSRLHPERPLEEMTVGEVMAWQDRIRGEVQSTAAGAYQIIRNTLRDIVKGAGIDTAERFDRAVQDRMAMWLLVNKRGFDKFLSGERDEVAMALQLAQEWAALPVLRATVRNGRPIAAGQSYYVGDGLNAAHAKVNEVRDALADAQLIWKGWLSVEDYARGPVSAPPHPFQTFLIWLCRALRGLFGRML